MTRQFVLYTGTLCHLCDQAKAVVYAVLPPGADFRIVNIDSDPDLQIRYGLRIPVFVVFEQVGEATEKGWPFTAGQIRRLMTAAP